MCNIYLRIFNPLLILLQILYKNSTYSLQIVKHIFMNHKAYIYGCNAT